MELSAHVWKSCAEYAQEENDITQTKTTGSYTVKWWVGNKYLEI